MTYDLVVRDGWIVDGSGLARFRADVGVIGDRIARVGRIGERGTREIDAEGLVVAPGFVDGHTHMDAQMLWDPLGTNSCWHGVTTVVMGNCGFSLAPCQPEDADLVFRNLEKAEDIPRAALIAGIDFRWDSFRSYLDVVDEAPKAINYASQIGHSSLRTWVMGQRAFEEEASDEDVAAMQRELRDAIRAGAVGFTTSRLPDHTTSDGRPVASRIAAWSEVSQLVEVLGDLGAGVFELATDPVSTGQDPEAKRAWFDQLGQLALRSGVPTSFGVFSVGTDPRSWQDVLAFVDETCDAGGQMFAQAHSRLISYLLSFRSSMPFDHLPVWEELRARPLEEQRRALTDPEVRQRLVAAAERGSFAKALDFDAMRVLETTTPHNPTVNEVAASRGTGPIETILDLAVESDLQQFFMMPSHNNNDLDAVLAIMRHPRSVMTFSDSGAHVSYIIDASIQTNLLSYWARERQAFTLEEAVRMITLAPARAWGFSDRGLLREGMIADINVFDFDALEPQLPSVAHDLPAGARRLVQGCDGFRATIVAGQTTIEEGEPTGARPGRLLRGPLADVGLEAGVGAGAARA